MKTAARIDLAVSRLQAQGYAFEHVASAPWIKTIEARLGASLPEAYRSLVSRYSFPVIELGPVELFSNLGDHSFYDLSAAPFRDPLLSQWLTQEGFFHFGRCFSESYDPICLNLRAPESANTAMPILRFNHEAILLECADVPRSQVAESFLALFENTL